MATDTGATAAAGLDVRVCASSEDAGKQAAAFVAAAIASAVADHGEARVIFATGASQFNFLSALLAEDVAWDHVVAFHLDEYVDLPATHPASFRHYLNERLFGKVACQTVHLLDPSATDAYGKLLDAAPIDVACIGIGENGHLAFNDPPVARFDDPAMVKIVELDAACRTQQVGEGWFATLDAVPTHAATLTIPAIMRAAAVSCVVPDARKAPAVRDALLGPVATACPASVLRRHANCKLFLDGDSAALYAAGDGATASVVRVPGLVDIQVNGYAGVDFTSTSLTPATFRTAALALLATGVRAFLPTVTTCDLATYRHVLPLLADAAAPGGEFAGVVAGIHLEGPFISKEGGAVGCHPRAHVQPASVAVVDQLLEWGRGHVRVMTLAAAADADTLAVVRHCVAHGVRVFLGHHLAGADDVAACAAAGATAFTHLGNGMPAVVHRHNNPLLVGLASPLPATVIADGVHLPLHVLQLLAAVKRGTLALVSDMAPVAGLPPGRYPAFGTEVEVTDDGAVRVPGQPTLAGASRHLTACVHHVVASGVMTPLQAWRAAVDVPAALAGIPPSVLRGACHPATPIVTVGVGGVE